MQNRDCKEGVTQGNPLVFPHSLHISVAFVYCSFHDACSTREPLSRAPHLQTVAVKLATTLLETSTPKLAEHALTALSYTSQSCSPAAPLWTLCVAPACRATSSVGLVMVGQSARGALSVPLRTLGVRSGGKTARGRGWIETCGVHQVILI